jgi:hypothetical protein
MKDGKLLRDERCADFGNSRHISEATDVRYPRYPTWPRE